MAHRGSPARRIVGNPLGGLLGEVGRRARPTSRRSSRAGMPLETDPDGSEVTRLVQPAGPTAAVAETDDEGRVRWTFGRTFAAPPVLTALPVDPDPDDDRAVTAVLEEVGTWYAVVRVWRTRPKRGQGVVEPAGPGVLLHLTAVDVSTR